MQGDMSGDGPKGPLRMRTRDRGQALRYAVLGNLVPVTIAVATDFDSHRAVFYSGAYGGLLGLTMLQAYSGGVASGYSVLMMMAMIWFGLQATDRELVAG